MGTRLKGNGALRAFATLLAVVVGGCGWAVGGCASRVRCAEPPAEAPPPAEKVAAAYHFLARQQDLFHRDFIVYDDHASGGVHFIPSGWMGDLESVSPEVAKGIVHDACTDQPKCGLTCIRFSYPAELARRGGRGWVGIFSQFPEDNWGDRRGYDLSRYCGPEEQVCLSFWARGSKGGEWIKFQFGGINRPPYYDRDFPHQDSAGPELPEGSMRDGFVRLTRGWTRYSIVLPAQKLRSVIGGFCWVTSADLNPDGATFDVDEIRIHFGPKGTAARLSEPRFIRSYVPELTGEPDQYVRNVCTIYDNALALMAFVARGRPDDMRRAALIADAFVFALNHDRDRRPGGDRLRNGYACGDLSDPLTGGAARLPGWWAEKPIKVPDGEIQWLEDKYFVSSDCGNAAWVILALLTYWEHTGRPAGSEHLEAAVRLGAWVHARKGGGDNDGYTGGLDGYDRAQKEITWKSTEHNIDLVVAFERLAAATDNADWKARADRAKQFVERMWKAEDRHFWTGTHPDGRTNENPIPLDVHPWAVLALKNGQYAAGLNWARDNCRVDQGGASGFDFKKDNRSGADARRGIWWEGTAQMALAYRMLGKTNEAEGCVNAIERFGAPETSGGGVLACHPQALHTGFERPEWGRHPNGTPKEWVYYRRTHVGATCWYLFAKLGWNPYWGGPLQPSGGREEGEGT